MQKKSFFQQVYAIVRKIPRGKVMTYGQIAQLLGKPRSSRQVGFALHANKDLVKIPCYRVVNRFGRCASGFAGGGQEAQKKKLEKDRIKFDRSGCLDLKRYQWLLKKV